MKMRIRSSNLLRNISKRFTGLQILKDKQDLAETQKELAKLHLVQKESSSSSHSQSTEERASETDHASEMQNQQLALALPHQVAPPQQQQPVSPHSQAPPRNLTQQSYYIPSNQLSNPMLPLLLLLRSMCHPHHRPNTLRVTICPLIHNTKLLTYKTHQVPQVQSFPQYQQQWPQQLPLQVQQQQQQQQSSTQPQMRPPSTPAYLPYPPTQSSNPSPEALQHSTPMQVSYSGVPQPMSSRVDTIPYGYGRTPPQQMKGTFEAQPRDEYQASGSHPSLPLGSAYTMYDREGGRTHHPYNVMVRNGGSSQYVRNHPYNDLIDKLASMGFRGDHVVGVIQRMEESGQPVDFNAVLDRLNAHPAGGSQRGGW